jgi:peptidoglycan DL-endopeptidase CwlO
MPGFPLLPLIGRQNRCGEHCSPCLNGIRARAPGRSRRLALSRPSPRRALTAGAIALAVIAPALDSAGRPTEAGASPPVTYQAEAVVFDPAAALALRRVERTSRSAVRRATTRAAKLILARPAVRALRAAAHRSVVRETARIVLVREATHRKIERSRLDRQARSRITTAARRDSARVTRRTARTARTVRTGRVRLVRRSQHGMAAVVAFARSQIGKSYVSGAEGPFSFDCSGLTKRAYALAGFRLPHSSGAQAARARTISRRAARAGDLVVGRGHVGIYMGNGMMIDAGNRRVGVTYRPLYNGLHIERF